jgi:hypothetical protein
MSPRRSRYVDRRSEISARLREIDEVMLHAEEQEDLVLRGYLTRLAVIQLSGFIEKSLEHMVNGFLEENSSHRVLRFGQRQAARFSNLNPTKLEQIVGSFDDEWRQRLGDFLSQDERRQTLGNLIGARHSLAHGGASAVSGTLLRQYHEIAEETVGLLSDMFVPLAKSSFGPAD